MFEDLFKDIEPLYHFTTFESAVRILATQKIKYSEMNKMNDPQESFRPISIITSGPSNEDPYKAIKKVKRELKNYQQISFSADKKQKKGFLLNNMWGSYADNGYGVCMVFDRQLLVEGLSPKKYGFVRYKKNYNPAIVLSKLENYKEKTIRNYIRAHLRTLFFQKSKEWEHEQEYRIIKKFADTEGDQYLVLHKYWDRVLKCVIFVNAHDVKEGDNVFDSSSYKAITKLIPDSCIAAQLAMDREGKSILYDSSSELVWGDSKDTENVKIDLSGMIISPNLK